MKGRKLRLVFLDAGTVDYGDLSLDAFRDLGAYESYFTSAPSEIASRIAGAEIILTNKCRLGAEEFRHAPNLKAIVLAATGFNNIDLTAAKASGIAVMNVPGYSTETVVQFTIGFILALAGNIFRHVEAVRAGAWNRHPFFTCPVATVREVAGKTLGIVGYGAIGRRVGEVARALGMKVIAAKLPGRSYGRREKVKRLPLEKLAAQADFLSVHAPLSDLTRDLIHAGILRKMKPGAHVINMARGGIVNETALREALDSGHLAGAALDVLTAEPPPSDHVLLRASNLLLTPHIAWASLEARTRLVAEMAANVRAFLRGRRRNRVA